MAVLALDDGEVKHAAEHVAAALALDPTLPDAHELLARLDVELFPMERPVFVGTVIARAHLLAARGEHVKALELLASAQRHDPRGRWAHVPWVLDPELPARVPQEVLFRLFGGLAPSLADPVAAEDRPALEPYVQLVRHSARTYPECATLLWAGSMLMRRAGEAEEAVLLADRSAVLAPSRQAAIAAFGAHRNLERWDEAEKALLRALEIDPDDLYVRTDLAELLQRTGRLEDGLAWVEGALRVDAEHEAAFPTACGLRFECDGDARHLIDLADHLRAHPENGHASRVLSVQSAKLPWLNYSVPATESVVNVLFQVLEDEGADAGGGALAVSAPEPPSALLAFSCALPDFTLSIEAVPEPDPRLPVPEVFSGGPVREVSRQVWRYEDATAVPAVPIPPLEAGHAVAALAESRWPHLPAAFDAAVRLSSLPLDDLLGVLVHPPALPYGRAELWPHWIRQVQAWACLGIAHHRGDQPWRESERRRTLVDLAYGPEDWVSEAAVLALIATAWVDPEARADVAELVGWRYLAAVEAGGKRPVTILDSLGRLVLVTPDVHPDVRSLAERWLSDDDADPGDADAASTGGV
ncbi:hypothetical protein SAMN05421505_113176 [Sinosporangium album]|uniref:Tetratricopeptide repeat-containing protein n=2 Tax=Sinosporangium album TaxID=504805 RepID=A0A1G8B717_9ACTN|nr:hypothetical protein SAMN05421505_113176 [Sinosporangium album]